MSQTAKLVAVGVAKMWLLQAKSKPRKAAYSGCQEAQTLHLRHSQAMSMASRERRMETRIDVVIGK